MSDLENTREGVVERINPGAVPAGILSIHLVRYVFAAPLCAGKSTLDIACGAGYGTAYLAPSVSSIVGMDADADAVAYATANYHGRNLRFTVGNALGMPFSDGSFERVVSFETIEHLPDTHAFLREIRRVIRQDGLFVVSTPLVAETNPRPDNPHHTIEYSLRDFRQLLDEHFGQVDTYGQERVQSAPHRWLQKLDFLGVRHLLPAALRKRATRAMATVPFEDMSLTDQRICRDKFDLAHDVLAVCTSPRPLR